MEKIYIGSGKLQQSQYGEFMKMSFSAEDVQKLQENLNGGWVNININKKRTPGERSTHYGVLDTWKPDIKKTSAEEARTMFPDSRVDIDEVPF